MRAKRTLDRLAVLNAPRAARCATGRVEIDVAMVGTDDCSILRGDQVPADGVVADSDGLEIDESLSTGESDPSRSCPATTCGRARSSWRGSGTVPTHRGRHRAYATTLAAEAAVHGDALRTGAGTNRLLRWIAIMRLSSGRCCCGASSAARTTHRGSEAVTGTVAALVGMVPEGLVLLTSLAFMVAAVSLTREQTLVQELPAVEGLARVDVVCLDKTGTLTHGDIVFDRLSARPVERRPRSPHALGAARPTATTPTRPPPRSRAGIAQTTWPGERRVPFSSARKWSAVIGGRARQLGARRAGDGAARPPAGRSRGRASSRHACRRRAGGCCCSRPIAVTD